VVVVICLLGTYLGVQQIGKVVNQVAMEAATKAARETTKKIVEEETPDIVRKVLAETKKTLAPPIEWLGVRVLTPVVKVGGVLELEYTAKINRQCPADIRAFLIRKRGDGVEQAAYRFPDRTGGYRLADPTKWQVILVKILIQDSSIGDEFPKLEPGEYAYRVRPIRYCADGVEPDNFSPDARFTLTR